MRVELTYIPAEYWNEPISGFELTSKGNNNLPKSSNFFLLWMPKNSSNQELTEQIMRVFPSIPANKLLSCKIRLALPLNSKESHRDYEKLFRVDEIIGKIVPIAPAVKLLYQLQIISSQNRGVKHYSNSIKTWAFLTKLIFELLNKGQFVPILESISENSYIGQWRLLLKSKSDNERFKTIMNNSSWLAFNLPSNFYLENGGYKTDGLWHPSYVFSNFIDYVGDYLIRSTLIKGKFKSFQEFYSTEIKKENDPDYKLGWDYKFLKSLLKKDPKFTVNEYYETILPQIVKNWVQSAQAFTIKQGISFNLELQYPENPEEDWPLSFSVSFQDEANPIPLKELWEGKSKRKKDIMKFFDDDEHYLEVILRAVGAASKIFPPIKRALFEKIPHEVELSSTEVMEFLKYPKDLLIQSGFNIVLPEAFTMGGRKRLSARLVIRSKDSKKVDKGTSSVIPSLFDINSMLEYKWEATLEGQKVSEEEFQQLINSPAPLINWKGTWILIDRQDMKALKNVKESGTKSYMEALKLGLTGKMQLPESGNEYEVVVEGVLSDIIVRLQSIDSFHEISCPNSFNGVLRPYQQEGLTWMGNMTRFNFGLCLADDMGLGKTIQVIAFLLYLKQEHEKDFGSILIVCPTSVLFNWKREFNKFAPDLEVVLHHGPDRVKTLSRIRKYLNNHQIILTSYGTVRNDIDLLQTIPFSGVIIDESQNIKNYASQQTQAILKLQSQFRIGLSGTPIENRLLELWTLFEFLNPGLLGTKSEFQNNYILPIERFQDTGAIDKLTLITSPFILRRVKSDKSIINDLPEKNEIKVYVELSKEQVKLYQELVEKSLQEIANESSNKRKKQGLVLGLLVKLKQICNHPLQYVKNGSTLINDEKELKVFLSRSKKLRRLLEMTEEVISNGEKILIFTQFKQMGDLLLRVLEQKYDFDILYFHGSVPESKRREIVDEFQSEDIDSPPIMILSLKAGGTGLNLTRGTTVFHYDRWWNPQTETQATDRAYRIGQKSRVNVYKFITVGTIEEKIDKLLEEKKELAESIIKASGESWVSDLSDDKLKELLLLSN